MRRRERQARPRRMMGQDEVGAGAHELEQGAPVEVERFENAALRVPNGIVSLLRGQVHEVGRELSDRQVELNRLFEHTAMLVAQTMTFPDVHSSLEASIRNLGADIADINDESKNRNSPIELDRRQSPALPVLPARTSIALREDIDLRTSPRRAAGVGCRMTWGDMESTKYSERATAGRGATGGLPW